ncbi:COG3650 family protein [Photobacterium profundum]|uniref:Lipoprotein n=1 Tax=Photobacterium profundum (strain SS9) TaxID=298386 RepID=Q6LVV2_PHOPR|nr:hypothetical protein [Photobacterium profundum]CAG18573.1 hypothetical protein PBPRA0134 [Photobacterium profundum SS9]
MTHPRMRTALPIAALIALTGCSTSTPSSSTSGMIDLTPPKEETQLGSISTTTANTDTVNANTQTNDSGKVQAFMMRGMVTLGHESNSIQPCGSTQQYWLTTAISDRSALEKITQNGYQAMYAEMIGFLEPAPAEGFATSYDGRFTVKQINMISAEMSGGCKQQPHTTRAFGNEPGWAAEIKNKQVTLIQMGKERQSQAITSTSSISGKQQYTGSDFNLTLTKAQCNDTMSDALFGWQSTLEWQGKQFKGCATIGATDVTLNWIGEYQSSAQATKNTGLTTTLVLNPDHSATTTYAYTNGDNSLVETGFWQQASQDTVQVMMTRHQGRRLNGERFFTLDGNTLITTEEVVNGQTYSLGSNGLQLEKQ